MRSKLKTIELTERRRVSRIFFGGIAVKWKKSYKQKRLNIWKNNWPRNILAGGAQEFGLGKSTISDLWRTRKNIEKFSAESGDNSGLKKRCLSGEIMIKIL